jgi:hypothetical protein
MRKENGEAKFIKTSNSQVVKDILDAFGAEEIQQLVKALPRTMGGTY